MSVCNSLRSKLIQMQTQTLTKPLTQTLAKTLKKTLAKTLTLKKTLAVAVRNGVKYLMDLCPVEASTAQSTVS